MNRIESSFQNKPGLCLITFINASKLRTKDEYVVALHVNGVHRGQTFVSKKSESPYWNSSFVFQTDNVVSVNMEIITSLNIDKTHNIASKRSSTKMARRVKAKSTSIRSSRGSLTDLIEGQNEQLIAMTDGAILKCRITYSPKCDIDASLASQNLKCTYVKLINARHLKVKSTMPGTYCILQCERSVVRTLVVPSLTEPVWNCGFLVVSRRKSSGAKVKIRVLGEGNEFLGQTRLHIEDVPYRAPGDSSVAEITEKWRDLEKKNHKPTPDSRLLIEAYNIGSTSPLPDNLYPALTPEPLCEEPDTKLRIQESVSSLAFAVRPSEADGVGVNSEDISLKSYSSEDDFDGEPPLESQRSYPTSPSPTPKFIRRSISGATIVTNTSDQGGLKNRRLTLARSQSQYPVNNHDNRHGKQYRRSSLDEGSIHSGELVSGSGSICQPVRTAKPKWPILTAYSQNTSSKDNETQGTRNISYTSHPPTNLSERPTSGSSTTVALSSGATVSSLSATRGPTPMASGASSSVQQSAPLSKSIPPNMCVYVKVCQARSLPHWPLGRNPRSFVSVSVRDRKAATKRLGEKPEFGSHSHISPKWNEVVLVPVSDKDGTVDIKVYTEITSTVMRDMSNAVGKAKFPIMYLPVLSVMPDGTADDVPDSHDTKGSVKNQTTRLPNTLSLTVSEKGHIEHEALQQIGPNKPASEPLTLWLTLEKPKRANPYMEMRAKRRSHNSHGELKVQLGLVPTPEELLESPDFDNPIADPGDPEGAVPIDIPEPLANIILDETMPCSASKLKELIITDEKSIFFTKYADFRKYTDLSIGSWVEKEDGKMTRDVAYTMPATSIVKANTATETQMLTVDEPGGFVLNISSVTPDVPFGTSFTIVVQLAVSRIDDTSSTLRVSSQCNWLKNIGFMKKAVENGSKNGVKTTYIEWLSVLKQLLSGGSKDSGNDDGHDKSSADNGGTGLLQQDWSTILLALGALATLLSIGLNVYLLNRSDD